MNAPAVAQPPPSSPKLIAPLWHTALFLLAVGGIAAWGAYRHGLAAFGSSRTEAYLFTIAWEWLLFALVAWGIRLGGGSIQSVIGGSWSTAKQFWRDLGIAVLFLVGVQYPSGRLAGNPTSGPECKHRPAASPERNRDHALDVLIAFGRNLRRVHLPRVSAKAASRLSEKCHCRCGDPRHSLWRSSRVSGTEAGVDDCCTGQPDRMAGAMAKEYKTRNDLAFSAGCYWRNCSGQALNPIKKRTLEGYKVRKK